MLVKPAIQGARRQQQETQVNGVAVFVFIVLMILSILIAIPMGVANVHWAWIVGELFVLNFVGTYILIAFKVADQWEKAILLRLGRFMGLKGPGPFWIIPIVDAIPAWVDHRVMVTPFTAERTLTKDTVPVDVDDEVPLNPFCDRGRINNPARFFDRQSILRELRLMLAQGNSVSLVGEVQIGKSSLLYVLFLTAKDWFPQGIVHYVDLQGVLDEADFCAEVLAGLGREPGDLRALKRALRRERLVLLLDEVEKLTRPAFTKDLHDLLRALAQEDTLTLAVASHRPLQEIFPPSGPTSPFHNIFTEKRLGPFSPADARAFLHHRLRGTGVVFTPEEVERLVMESGGHPARLQELAYRLFEEKRARR